MAAKTNKKNTLPRIHKKWYDFKIDPSTLRPIRFSWNLANGTKTVIAYDSPNVPSNEIMDMTLRRYVASYYFVFDKPNKRIFAYPVILQNNDTRSSCEKAHYEKLNVNCFYMFDEDKQIWEIPYKEYRKYCGYDYAEHRSVYEMVKAEPQKKSRLSTYYYKVQCQQTSYIRQMFAALYGKDFVYQHRVVTDDNIRCNTWIWTSWLQTKGRKYSEKTKKSTQQLMSQFTPEQRKYDGAGNETKVILEQQNGIVALCYYCNGTETFRRIFNNKTGKLENFIWKNGEWCKSSKLSRWLNIGKFEISDTYKETCEYDWKFLDEARQHYIAEKDKRRCWYSDTSSMYNFAVRYITHPVIHQMLQIMNYQARINIYRSQGDISTVFGSIPNRGKTMFAKLGVNKYQFDHTEVIHYVKWLLNENNISHIDNDTWDKYSKAFSGKTYGNYSDQEIIDYLKAAGEFSVDRWIKICDLDDADHDDDVYYCSSRVKQLYKDYFKSLSAISEFGIDISSYPLMFNDVQQLQRFHDEASRAASSVRNKDLDEKFSLLYTKRLKMLETDGEYCIEMPKCSADLTEEGSKLRHCVGGYVRSVADGHTAIYFLRKAEAPDVPWLTVEVRNKQCQQIHGSCNAWMGSKDEYFAAVPFLVYWFEKHAIEYNDNLLTNMATGYGASSNHRTMPTEAIEQYKALRKLKKSS